MKSLEQVIEGKFLTRVEARSMLHAITREELNGFQIAAFLTALRMRSLSPEELSGFRDALLDVCTPLTLKGSFIDMCGTGGDGKDSFNISTCAAFVTAGAGVRVAKHGNYSFSSSCGSSNLLEALGITFSSDPEVLQMALDTAGICLLHAPLFHGALKSVQPVRRALGIRTFFNLLGPLVNPARPAAQVIGVASLEVGRLYQAVLEEPFIQYAIVHSLDGYDEASLTGVTRVITRERLEDLAAKDFGLSRVSPGEIKAQGSPADEARSFYALLEGNGTEARKQVVVANAALAIRLARPDLTLRESALLAQTSLQSGAALHSFQRLKELMTNARSPKGTQ